MTFSYIRKRYGLDVKRGDLIEFSGFRGRLVRCTRYLHLRFSDCLGRFHPCDEDLVFVSADERRTKAEAKEARRG